MGWCEKTWTLNYNYFIMVNMKKQQVSQTYASRLFRFLPLKQQVSFVKWLLDRHFHSPLLCWPYDFSNAKKALFIMPEDPFDALNQISNFLALKAILKKASITMLCEEKVYLYLKNIADVDRTIQYAAGDRFMFSRFMRTLNAGLLKEAYDLCFMLDPSPDLSILYYAGRTRAPLRAGYCGAAGFPFLNLHIKPSPVQVHLNDYYNSMARIFGAQSTPQPRWSVQREAIDEVGHLLHEYSLAQYPILVGVDAQCFLDKFGASWVKGLIESLKANAGWSLFVLADGEPDQKSVTCLRELGLPVLTNLPVSRWAALFYRTELVISGRTAFFELAALLQRPALGVFEEQEFDICCNPCRSVRGVSYSVKADSSTIGRIFETALQMTTSKETRSTGKSQ